MTQLSVNEIAVVGSTVIRREFWKSPLSTHAPIAEFSSYGAAVIAVKLLKRADWLAAAELTLDDEDFMTIQVLVRRLNKTRPKAEFRNPNQLSPRAQSESTRGVKLEDLL